MKEISKKYCEMLIQNRNQIRECFPWESAALYAAVTVGIVSASASSASN